MNSTIPTIASADDLPTAIQAAVADPSIRWYVTKKANALHQLDQLPDDWDLSELSIVAASRFFSAENRRNLAKKGNALPDGSFPIPDRDALRRAIIRLNSTNKDKSVVRRHIIKRARALGALKMLPSTWSVTASTGEDLDEPDESPAEVQVEMPTPEQLRREKLSLQMGMLR